MIPTRRELLPLAASIVVPARVAEAEITLVADAVSGTTLPAGVHQVTANTTIKGDLLLQPGATIEIAAGRTLILLGGLVAPVARIFTGAGSVDLNRSRITHAHPEWWGAAPNDGAHDSLPALHACLAAHPAMQLLAADYFISDTFVVDRPFCRITGAGFRGTGQGQGTRLVVTSGTADVLRAGPATRPRTVNDFLQSIEIRALALVRSVPVDTSIGLPAGLRAQFLLFAAFEQVSAFEHATGVAARGLVRSTLTDCVAFRSLPGRQDGQPWRGFLLDGTGDIGLAGGNASLFLERCNATIGGDPAVSDAVGLLLEGAFADSFVTGFETAGVATGIRVDGRTSAIGARGRHGHINLHLRMPIIDQCGRVGIDIRDTSPQGVIDLAEPYVATASGAEAALRFTDMRGMASVTGGQLVASPGGRATGLSVRSSRGVQVDGLKILDQARPAEILQSTGVALRLTVAAPGSRSEQAAVVVRDCEGGSVQMLLSGQEGAFAAGVRVEGRAARLRIDRSGIDPAAVGGLGNRVIAPAGVLVEGA